MKGLRCFPQYFNLNEANQLAHSIYPYLLFISSGFLFLTFVVYAFLASEIFNAHGKNPFSYNISSFRCGRDISHSDYRIDRHVLRRFDGDPLRLFGYFSAPAGCSKFTSGSGLHLHRIG
jgi:hypothetical protein